MDKPEPDKICHECKWCEKDNRQSGVNGEPPIDYCTNPTRMPRTETFLVTGAPITNFVPCKEARAAWNVAYAFSCGPDGHLWTPA